MSPTDDHLTDAGLKQFRAGELPAAELDKAEAHLNRCDGCLERLEELKRQEAGSFGPGEQSPEPGPAAAAQAPEGPPPLDIPGYEVLGELGRGGMGVVYKARQLRPDRVVALKMIRSGDLASPQEVARFRREAEAVARLQHPHVVQVYEVSEYRGRSFFSMEFVDGGSLDEKLRGTPQPVREAAQLVETLARTIHYAHQRGIVHRDLKPANVLLTPGGVPKIADFGLAKRLEGGETRLTPTRAILGTPEYMAPEQASQLTSPPAQVPGRGAHAPGVVEAAGKAREIGPAADVYALGVILYELLTGRPPFRADTPVDTLLQVLSEEPVRPRRLVPKVPRDLETICLKCLEKDARRRYAAAQELADDLKAFLEGGADQGAAADDGRTGRALGA
jgi:serine/threonine-protein kinase